jgi:hypothetical protein
VPNRDAEHQQILMLATDAVAAARHHDRGVLITTTRTLLRALAVHFDNEALGMAPRDEDTRDGWRAAVDALAEEYVGVLRSCSQTPSASECACEPLAFSALGHLATQLEGESPNARRRR